MIELWHVPLLFAGGVVAGLVDSIAGGGGLITLPVLLGLGMDPRAALGTNKLQSTFGAAMATYHYAAAGTMSLRECVRGFAITFIGAIAGALVVQTIDAAMLRRVIPFLLISMALFVWLRPKLGETDLHPRIPRGAFDLVFGLALGFYDGFFGPGVGTFWTMAFVLGLGFNLTKATGSTKAMNLASNIASLLVFIIAGQVVYTAGLIMGAGQLIGARMGSRIVVSRGTRFIRPIFLTTVLAISIKLIYDAFFKVQ
jgi:uncharacterized membrane protein YfcA